MQLPALESLTVLDSKQLTYADELMGILTDADQQFLPDWEFRAQHMTSSLGRNIADFRRGIGIAACDAFGVPANQQPGVLRQYDATLLAEHIGFLNGHAHDMNEQYFRHWGQAAVAHDGLERAIHAMDPHFATNVYMLGTEMKAHNVVHLLNNAANGGIWAELEFYIGDTDDTDPEDARNFDPEDALGNLERGVMRYARFAKRGCRPIDPETLIDTIGLGMLSAGMLPTAS